MESNDSNTSVYQLIESLCKCLINENANSQTVDTKILKKCKSRAYEILLNKSSNAIDRTVDPTEENIDFQQFSMRIQCKNKIDHRRCDDLDEVIDGLYNHGIVDDECGHQIISLLILLKDSIGSVCSIYMIMYLILFFTNISTFSRFLNQIIIKNTQYHNMEPYQKDHNFFGTLYKIINQMMIILIYINRMTVIHLLR